jgi:hypothetical protein
MQHQTTERGDSSMKIDEIKEIAKQHDIKAGKAKKGDLVRAIQQAEGNNPCFDSNSSRHCGQPACMWRGDCT